jgi:hypothetical protein
VYHAVEETAIDLEKFKLKQHQSGSNEVTFVQIHELAIEFGIIYTILKK